MRTLLHGASRTMREYRVWWDMQQRCRNPSVRAYPNYGGRGIRVHARWLGPSGFLNFIADMGQRPSPRHSIERIDNAGNYEPGNCRWATMREQLRNTRRCVNITVNGVTADAADWADRLGTKSDTITERIRALGWDPVRAATTPVRKRRTRAEMDLPRWRFNLAAASEDVMREAAE